MPPDRDGPAGGPTGSAAPLLRTRGSGLAWLIARRYLRGRQSRLLGSTARAALLAVALGVTAMVIAMALMTGYREDLQRKLIGGNAAVVAYPIAPADAPEGERLAALRALPGVTEVRSVAYAQGTVASAAAPDGLEVTVRGVEPGTTQLFGSTVPSLAAGATGVPALVGAELAHRLQVGKGEPLRLVLLTFRDGRPRFRFQSVQVAGSFATGFAEFDASWVVVDLAALERLAASGSGGRLVELAIEDPRAAPIVAAAAEKVLGAGYIVTDWQQLNRELFTALQLQQLALFLVLGLIVVVSTFNVASTLVVLVRERRRDIGVLAALGLAPGPLRAIFLLYGTALGALGIVIGIAVGSTAAWVLDTFRLIRFGPDVAAIYFLDAVPFRVDPGDLAAIAGFGLVVTLLACWLPSRRAVRLEPSAALRYE